MDSAFNGSKIRIRVIDGVRKDNCICAPITKNSLNTRSEKNLIHGFSHGIETLNGREFVHGNLSQSIYQSLTSEGYFFVFKLHIGTPMEV